MEQQANPFEGKTCEVCGRQATHATLKTITRIRPVEVKSAPGGEVKWYNAYAMPGHSLFSPERVFRCEDHPYKTEEVKSPEFYEWVEEQRKLGNTMKEPTGG